MAVVQESALRRMAPAVSLSQAENSCTRRFDPDRPIHSFHSHRIVRALTVASSLTVIIVNKYLQN